MREDYGCSGPGRHMLKSGRMCSIFEPDPDLVDVYEIAHALSNLCRFSGHTRSYYSVAQHSVLVSLHVPPEHALAGLLHDAAEAYLGDLIRPIKILPQLTVFRESEEAWRRAIFTSQGLDPDLPESVHVADNRALTTEFRDLFPRTPFGDSKLEPFEDEIVPLLPPEAYDLFIERWQQLV